jgi:hypothetical protein
MLVGGPPISGPERNPVPEACSPNGMPSQGPFLFERCRH